MKQEREYGIDALRIVAMGMIVIHHVLVHGGILDSLKVHGWRYMTAWYLQAAVYGAVNCYGLISGYVGVKSKHRYSSIAVLWIQVAFYAVVLSVMMHVVMPGTVSAKEWMNGLCPVSLKLYWYYTAYFFISFLFPLVNRVLRDAPKQEIVLSLTAIVILLSVNNVFFRDIFFVNNGYSPLWLLVLYMIGGTIRLHGEDLKSYRWIRHHAPALFLLGTTVAWTLEMLGEGKPDGIRFLFDRTIQWHALYAYNSPAIILSSVALFALLSGWKPGKAACRWIGVLAPTTFGVYLIHEHPLVRSHVIRGTFISLTQLKAYLMPFAVIGVAAAVFAVCATIDLLRGKLFRLLKVKERCQWAFERIGLS